MRINSMNILIVDDERYSVKAICECVHWDTVSEEKVEVFKAYNSAQAKKIFGEREIQVLICDVEMPRENGIELIRWMREMEKETEVIIITCHAEFEYAKEAISFAKSCNEILALFLSKYKFSFRLLLSYAFIYIFKHIIRQDNIKHMHIALFTLIYLFICQPRLFY